MSRALPLAAVLAALAACDDDCEPLADRGQGAPGRWCGAREARLAIAQGFGVPVVEASVDGAPRRLLVDTGATAPLVFSATLLGAADESWTAVDSICFADGPCVEDVDTWALDSPFSTDEAEGLNGIVGMALLGRLVVEIDRLDTLTLRLGGEPCAGSAVALDLGEDGRPLADAAVEGHPLGPVLVDTGARDCLLGEESLLEVPELRDGEEEEPGCSIEGCQPGGTFVSRAERYCVGEVCAKDVAVKYPVWDAIGSAFLTRFRIAFDFAAARLIVCD